MYENNYSVLAKVCAEKAVIRHVSKHRKSDGTMDVEGNLRIWLFSGPCPDYLSLRTSAHAGVAIPRIEGKCSKKYP